MSKAVVIPGCNKDLGMKSEISVSPTEKKDGAIGLFSRFLRFDSLKRSPESPVPSEPPVTYYGVYIPCEIKKGPDEEAIHVYEQKSQALELVKRYKSSRFKAFKNHQDAVSFALRGAEPTDTVDGNDNSLVGEKPYPFKAPSPQDMVALRKAIEAGLTAAVRERVWDNPRYLVSSGNTPAILQEGSRYNALHVAAKALNAEICNLILTTVGNPLFVQALYGADSDFNACKEFSSILVDRYLNTPDKAMNETPLHFAAKFGGEEVVDLLTSFPQCNKEVVNKYGEQPKDVICKRCATPNPGLTARVAAMLRDKCYVPVFHTEDDSDTPTVGRVFTPARPPELQASPLSPRYEIRAFAGPMARADAEQFRRRWRTPPRDRFRLHDVSKGLETQGRNLAEQMHVSWKEYWPFLDTFTDLRTPEGLSLLENYLQAKYESACSFAYTDSCAQSQIMENISFSRLSLGNMTQHSSTPIKDILSPMSELCVALNSCKISDSYKKTDPIRQRMCRQPIRMGNHFVKPILTNGDVPTSNHTVSQLLCIERTCQVFAKRIADALNFSLTAELEVAGESLKSEAKHLQHTINTYMNDERFKSIDFSLTHSRLAQLVVSKLKQQTSDLDDINTLVEFLDKHSPVTYKGPNKVKATIDSHVKCLARYVARELSAEAARGPAGSEADCADIWQKASSCECAWQLEQFERNSKKNASFRKNRSLLSTYSDKKGDSFIRRLSFDQDIGDGAQQSPSSQEPLHVNSPAGDSALYTVETDKCQVVAEISDDESDHSPSESDDFETASERSASDASMQDASDRALAEPFIYGEEPSKVDRLVWEALTDCAVDAELYPNVARWRHTVALYTEQERSSWPPAPAPADDSIGSHNTSWVASPARTPCSTPSREHSRNLPLQVSNWLRVTGPHSPRSALASKSVGHNVSFGF